MNELKSGATAPVAVIDIGARALKLMLAEPLEEGGFRVLEDLSRSVLLGRDTFTNGRLSGPTVEAALRALKGFRRVLDEYGVERCRTVATSAIREAQNRDAFVDRVRLKTGLEVEVIDGPEENRLTFMAVREALRGHEVLASDGALLVEVGGGSVDLAFLEKGEPTHSGTYALGSIRMRQSLASWHGAHEHRVRLLRRHIHNVIEDLKRELPLGRARHFVALGGDAAFVVERVAATGVAVESGVPRDAFLEVCDEVAQDDVEQLVERHRLQQAEAETLGPALLVLRELIAATPAAVVLVPQASLRLGLLLDLVRVESGHGIEDFSRQVLASARALGEKYRFDAPHGNNVAQLALRLFDELLAEHGLSQRHRLLLEVAALLHDIGIYVNLRGHHKHSHYLLSVSDIFGLSREDMALVGNAARYHRRALPQRSHPAYMALDRDERLEVSKLAGLLRLANALDADHLQKVRDLRVQREGDLLVVEIDGAGDLTMERLASLARTDLLSDVLGVRISFREWRRE